MVFKHETNVILFRREANENDKLKRGSKDAITERRPGPNAEESGSRRVDKIDIWLLTEEQIRKVVNYFIRNNNILSASEFAYKASIAFESKAIEGIPGAEECRRRYLVLAKTLFRRYNNLEGARWAEQKLLGFSQEEIDRDIELHKRESVLRIMRRHGEINNREEVKEFLRAFRKEKHRTER